MNNITSFKKFESNENYIDYDEIKYIFIELIDHGYEMGKYVENMENIGKYFFEFKKKFSDESFDYVDNEHVYGYSDLDGIKSEIEKSLLSLDDARHKLNKLGYTIAFEFEFNFAMSAMITLVCHMHHSKYDQ